MAFDRRGGKHPQRVWDGGDVMAEKGQKISMFVLLYGAFMQEIFKFIKSAKRGWAVPFVLMA